LQLLAEPMVAERLSFERFKRFEGF